MPDVGNQLAGTAVNMGVGRGLSALGARIPVPIPSFYNANSPNHFRDSQAMQILHGNPNAIRHYAGRAIGATAGNAIFPVLGGMVGSWAGPHLADLLSGHGWNGNKVPDTHVQVGDINTDGSGMTPYIDQNTGQVSYIPEFSNFGPYANGYQGMQQSPSSYFPDFSQYGNPNPEAPRNDYVSVQPGDNGYEGGDSGGQGGGMAGGQFGGYSSNLPGGGNMNYMNGASTAMASSFAPLFERHEGIQKVWHGPVKGKTK